MYSTYSMYRSYVGVCTQRTVRTVRTYVLRKLWNIHQQLTNRVCCLQQMSLQKKHVVIEKTKCLWQACSLSRRQTLWIPIHDNMNRQSILYVYRNSKRCTCTCEANAKYLSNRVRLWVCMRYFAPWQPHSRLKSHCLQLDKYFCLCVCQMINELDSDCWKEEHVLCRNCMDYSYFGERPRIATSLLKIIYTP